MDVIVWRHIPYRIGVDLIDSRQHHHYGNVSSVIEIYDAHEWPTDQMVLVHHGMIGALLKRIEQDSDLYEKVVNAEHPQIVLCTATNTTLSGYGRTPIARAIASHVPEGNWGLLKDAMCSKQLWDWKSIILETSGGLEGLAEIKKSRPLEVAAIPNSEQRKHLYECGTCMKRASQVLRLMSREVDQLIADKA